MGLNRLLKKLAPGETLEEALYKKLTENLYKTGELGEGMGVVYQLINGWWKPRYILNHNTKTAFEFMSRGQYLMTVKEEDIEWSTLKELPEDIQENARAQFAMYPTFVEGFSNGVAREGFDILLHHFFEKARWERALDSGVGKKLNYAILRELAKPETRIMIFRAIANNQYEISAPRSVLIPKDNKNEFREVYINDDIDRIFLSIANDLFFEYMPEMVHPSCKSYLKGIGCGRIVRSVSKYIASFHTDGVEAGVIGWKADLSKYFDTVPLHVIDSIFDRMEAKYGKSAIVRIVRKYYHCKEYKDKDGNPRKKYMSLRQGCAVSAFLANAVLFEVDKQLSTLDGYFVRYSDDMLYIGHDWQKAMEILKVELQKIGLQLNPRKFSPITDSQWFNFLGFSIKGGMVSLSPSQIKKFQKEITRRIRRKGLSYALAVKKVNKYLYVGNGEYCWANRVLPFINSEKDIQTLNNYVMDCLRSVKTGRHHLGGLGYDKCSNSGCIRRGTGRNVKHNREIVPKKLDGYITIGCMQKAMRYSNEVYEALVRQLNTQ